MVAQTLDKGTVEEISLNYGEFLFSFKKLGQFLTGVK